MAMTRAITLLQITNFRNIAAATLNPCQGNIIYGVNGSGKTSLLEAIYYLGVAKSFRGSAPDCLIRQAYPRFSLYAQLLTEHDCPISVGVEREQNNNLRLRVAAGEASSVSELAYLLPVRLIHSHSHHLFEAGPLFRRKYLDWGLFYHYPPFLAVWRQFERTLKQRNANLKEKKSRQELEPWTNELAKFATTIHELRCEYIQYLKPVVLEMVQALLPDFTVDLQYNPGWPGDLSFAELMLRFHPEEYRLGYTLYGPHRADLQVTINQVAVKHILSRGQQKLLICAMILAQGILLSQHTNKTLTYLVDDLPAELDFQSRNKLISLLFKQKSQVFITAIEHENLAQAVGECAVPMKLFHVEHGRVQSVPSELYEGATT